ncbi:MULTISPECIES: YopX family protein [Bacillales]|uniref:YopX family protein n=1 Tax=Bacillales TaxID=1385 RepID=UPI000A3037C0|nr:YopX family protein [Staphylococcus aureus]WAI29926.1 MAG: YopX family protein [Bacillus paranthracis]SME22289.1 YopX protein [Bacillus cereus]MBK3312535.1 hypothetical protein [Staphylococcus aureus]WAI35759.1 MAG: YopX family protein [Bacillus paranthracis]WAI41570.1 MAG: YopX family protein [Bacillus paranthracis]
MDEIKYRIYGKENRIMYSWEEILNFDSLKDTLKNGGKENQYYSPLLRYTGLKDKNGKEVYEGDILKEKDIITEVVFHDYQWKEKLISSPRNHLKNYFPFRDTLPFTAEVLGNIYENPELLKK